MNLTHKLKTLPTTNVSSFFGAQTTGGGYLPLM